MKKLEQIKQLQEDLFVEEHGITKEQARKLNEFIFREPTGKEFDFWAGCDVPKPSVDIQITRLKRDLEEQNKRFDKLEWEHKKLWMGTWFYTILSATAIIMIFIELSR